MAFGMGKREVSVHAGELVVSAEPRDVLVARGLGSCVAVAICDPAIPVAGLAHVFLPSRDSVTERRRRHGKWDGADDAIPELLRQLRALGARDRRMQVVLAGGSTIGPPGSGVGDRNQAACRALIAQAGLADPECFMGGTGWRSVTVVVGSGEISVIAGEAAAPPPDFVPKNRPRYVPKKTEIGSVDDVMSVLEDLAAQGDAAKELPDPNRKKRTPRPNNADEIADLLGHMLPPTDDDA